MSQINTKAKTKSVSLIVLIVFNVIIVSAAIGLSIYKGSAYQKTRQFIHPVKPEDWQTEDKTIYLYSETHYPLGYENTKKYPTILLFHGMTRTLEDYDHLVKELTSRGILCFLIDFRGHGKSTGEFPKEDLLRNVTFGDSMGAFRYMVKHPNADPDNILALGTSMGGGNSMFLAIANATNKFVLWYPGVAYILGDKPLYQHNLAVSNPQALIIVGTEDECGNCKPSYVQTFADNNNLQITWFEGATHTDSRYYSDAVAATLKFLGTIWNLNDSLKIIPIITQSAFIIGLVGIIALVDIIYILRKKLKKKKVVKQDEGTGFDDEFWLD